MHGVTLRDHNDDGALKMYSMNMFRVSTHHAGGDKTSFQITDVVESSSCVSVTDYVVESLQA